MVKNSLQWTSAVDKGDHYNREKASFLKENILPIQENGKLHLIESDGELFPGISVRIFNGHTDGQVIPLIKNGDKTVVYMAEAAQNGYVLFFEHDIFNECATVQETERGG